MKMIFVYIILAVLNFVPVPLPARMILPLAWLTLCAMYKKQWVLMAALFLSFLGDVMGWRHELIPQPSPLRPAYHDSLLRRTVIPFWGRTTASALYKERIKRVSDTYPLSH